MSVSLAVNVLPPSTIVTVTLTLWRLRSCASALPPSLVVSLTRPVRGTVNERLPNEIAFALPFLGIVKRMLPLTPGVARNENANA